MKMTAKHLVLAGGGHAHLFVLQALARRRPKNIDVTLISPSRWQYYSGMIPGWMSGYYRQEDCRIDLAALAYAAGVNFIEKCVVAMRADAACVSMGSGGHITYDLLSLDVGGEPDESWTLSSAPRAISVRPMSGFVQEWTEGLSENSGRSLAIIGGGAGGVELAFAAKAGTEAAGSGVASDVSLVCGETGILESFPLGARRKIERKLSAAGVHVLRVRAVASERGILLSNGQGLEAEKVFVATGTKAPLWLQLSGLGLGDEGYVQVNKFHQIVSHPNVFAAGDVCDRVDFDLPKSGVHAVRAGAVLAHNLLAMLTGGRLRPYVPKRSVLYLISTGDKSAVASWGWWSAQGRWVWKWKDLIDRSFIRKFRI